MKRFHVFTISLFAAFAMGAVVTSPALAAESVCFSEVGKGWYMSSSEGLCLEPLPEDPTGNWESVEFLLALWLEGGVAVSALLPVVTEGALEFVSLDAGGLNVVAKTFCSVVLDGWVGTESLDFVSELLTLAGVGVPLVELTGPTPECVNEGNCEHPEVWAAGLGWETVAELYILSSGGGGYVDLLFKAGVYTTCTFLGIKVSETCTGTIAIRLKNEANGTVDDEWSDPIQHETGLTLADCSLGGEETGEIIGLTTTLESGVTLSVSSE